MPCYLKWPFVTDPTIASVPCHLIRLPPSDHKIFEVTTLIFTTIEGGTNSQSTHYLVKCQI